MNDLDLDGLLGAEDDEGPRRRSRGSRSAQRRSKKRQRRQRRKGYVAFLAAMVIIVGVLGAGGYYGYNWLRGVAVPKDFTGQGTGEVVVEIKQGQSASEVAQTLVDQGVVASERAFINAIGAAGKSASLQPGDYKLRKGMSAAAAVPLLDPERRLQTTLTLREGLRLSQILQQLATATGRPVRDFQKAAKDAEALDLPSYARKRLEGFAFPATYEVSPKSTPEDLLAAMVARYKKAADDVGLAEGARRLGHTPMEIMTIASIVQAESGSKRDMAKIARVIYNRLERTPPMMLQMDSTVMYALNKFGVAATHAETKNKSRYNTYAHPGLPPGPIGNPGEDAIKAALEPADGPWLFFVTVDTKRGITKYTDSQAEHDKFVEEFNRNQAAG
ncbi:ABC transporter substrate-binding protein [Sphaerisporangium melleum]|uniref:Endolytic murein transglycosylase n=1 Tax=Sphaerisporangium melleum TaxID=321316 RepID=A0A917R3Q3_9ACTN|nr:endolytic transglycosylase MltG [Sphaerisporangium melleum]GGK87046.1 ABC transporter substrate-binding protein [Sphaerisporangium melleum]GII72349.1 ABC transporter substrate-binding protein [Sphaerisporangium melleum]